MNKQEHEALRLCVESLDQLLPYLAKVPADVGLLNDALMAARPLLKVEPVEPAPAQETYPKVGPVTYPRAAGPHVDQFAENVFVWYDESGLVGGATNYLSDAERELRSYFGRLNGPAPAQDEREAKAWPALAGIGRDSGHPRAVVLYLRHEPSDEHLRMIQEALRTRPAQTAPQGKFAIGDRVKKTSGSEWVGHVCGTYSTALTPEGYAVESEAHAGSVQIYPDKALEAAPKE